MKGQLWPVLVLVILGAGWGLTQPLAKIAVSQGHQPFGLIFWQLVIGAFVMSIVTFLRGKRLPTTPAALRLYVIIALIGTVLPNSTSYLAISHLPSGLISILLSLVPMFAFPIALVLAVETFAWRRLFGLMLGMLGVVILVAPEASLPVAAMIAWVPLALIAPLFYGLEGNVVAKWGTLGMDAMQVLAGASIIGAIISFPLAMFWGQWINPLQPWGAPEWALVAASLVHVSVYAGYVWLVGRAGAVFAAQVSYLVTGFGVFWAMLVLGERYSSYFWLAGIVMILGVFLVQPRRRVRTGPAVVLEGAKP